MEKEMLFIHITAIIISEKTLLLMFQNGTVEKSKDIEDSKNLKIVKLLIIKRD